MKKSRFTECQITRILAKQEMKVSRIYAANTGSASLPSINCKSKYSGMDQNQGNLQMHITRFYITNNLFLGIGIFC